MAPKEKVLFSEKGKVAVNCNRFLYDVDSWMMMRLSELCCTNVGIKHHRSGLFLLCLVQETLMEIARTVNDLMVYYSSKEMRELLVAVFQWYRGYNKRDRAAWQERANEWARTLMRNRLQEYDELDELGKLAEQMDMARRAHVFFFSRYMVVYSMGQISQEMFAEADFPGMARMYELIDHIEPLDHANYHVIMHGDPGKWMSKQPKVYPFLKELIIQKKKERAILRQMDLEESRVTSVSPEDGCGCCSRCCVSVLALERMNTG